MRFPLLAMLIIALTSCAPSPDGGVFTVTAYNACAFFDSIDDGTEYEGFSRRDGYDGEKYSERVRSLALLLGRHFASSDVIILSEIESVIVLHDLLESGLDQKGFSFYGLAADGSSALYTGFISKSEPVSVTMHSFPECRPILSLTFNAGGESVKVFGVHFRSRIDGGEDERYEQAMHLRTLIEASPGVISLAAGDFNTDPRFPERSLSLFPDHYDPECAIHVTGDPSEAGYEILYSPFLDRDTVLSEKGTFCYQGEWMIYDNILLSEEAWDGRGWEYGGASIGSAAEMKDLLGRPRPYDPSDGSGYSDHFPVTVSLVMR